MKFIFKIGQKRLFGCSKNVCFKIGGFYTLVEKMNSPKNKVADRNTAPNDLQPHYGNGVFGNVYLLALDNTKR